MMSPYPFSLSPTCLLRVVNKIEPFELWDMYLTKRSFSASVLRESEHAKLQPKKASPSSALSMIISHNPQLSPSSHDFTSPSFDVAGSLTPGMLTFLAIVV